jgi:hypothetical protein
VASRILENVCTPDLNNYVITVNLACYTKVRRGGAGVPLSALSLFQYMFGTYTIS